MDMNEFVQPAISALMENLRTQEAKQAMARHFLEENLIDDSDAYFGNAEEVSEEITRSSPASKADTSAMMRAVGAATVDLNLIYQNRQRKVDRIFSLSIIAVGLFLLLLAAGLFVAFLQENAAKMGMLTSAGSLIPGFLAATAFLLYKKESTALKTIEEEITKMKRIENFFDLVKNIKDENTLNEAYKQLVAQMQV
jgi:hypothetical protein